MLPKRATARPDAADALPPGEGMPVWHEVPIYEGRDLASAELWELSHAVALSKRAIAKDPPRLPKARRAGISLVVAAVTAATPALSFAHRGSGGKASAAARQLDRSLLELGDRGPAVAALQQALGLQADGVFGPKTLAAVRAFQADHGLPVDGIAGPGTRAALLRGAGGGGLLELGDRGRAVAALQRALGLEADGVFGPQTRKAVRALQKWAGLTVDGVAGPQTRAALERRATAAGVSRGAASDGVLELGDRGAAVAAVQRALGLSADGVFGRETRRAVRAFQRRAGLEVDGIVGQATRAALGRGAGQARGDGGKTGRQREESRSEETSAPSGVDPRLGEALGLARSMGLKLISAHRPGAIIESSGAPSDHGVYPSKAIDLQGSAAVMKRYARAVAGLPGVQIVIYSGVGMWIHGGGWRAISSSVTHRTHLDHVHVDTF